MMIILWTTCILCLFRITETQLFKRRVSKCTAKSILLTPLPLQTIDPQIYRSVLDCLCSELLTPVSQVIVSLIYFPWRKLDLTRYRRIFNVYFLRENQCWFFFVWLKNNGNRICIEKLSHLDDQHGNIWIRDNEMSIYTILFFFSIFLIIYNPCV